MRRRRRAAGQTEDKFSSGGRVATAEGGTGLLRAETGRKDRELGTNFSARAVDWQGCPG